MGIVQQLVYRVKYSKEVVMQFRSERLREAREKKGITQRELAHRCGINEFQISRYETGKTEPSLVNLALIARHLEISSDYLLNLTNDSQKRFGDTEIADEERTMLETFRREGWPGVIRLGAERISR
jgi:transcriptional regulator with XRE-family HTH domain